MTLAQGALVVGLVAMVIAILNIAIGGFSPLWTVVVFALVILSFAMSLTSSHRRRSR